MNKREQYVNNVKDLFGDFFHSIVGYNHTAIVEFCDYYQIIMDELHNPSIDIDNYRKTYYDSLYKLDCLQQKIEKMPKDELENVKTIDRLKKKLAQYTKAYNSWKSLELTDDRLIYINCYEHLYEAIYSLKSNYNRYVILSFTEMARADMITMQGILKRFT